MPLPSEVCPQSITRSAPPLTTACGVPAAAYQATCLASRSQAKTCGSMVIALGPVACWVAALVGTGVEFAGTADAGGLVGTVVAFTAEADCDVCTGAVVTVATTVSVTGSVGSAVA